MDKVKSPMQEMLELVNNRNANSVRTSFNKTEMDFWLQKEANWQSSTQSKGEADIQWVKAQALSEIERVKDSPFKGYRSAMQKVIEWLDEPIKGEADVVPASTQWVKAVDRLPKRGQKVFWKRTYKDNSVYTGYGDFDNTKYMELPQIEWLDESPTSK